MSSGNSDVHKTLPESIVVVIPVLNEELHIARVLAGLKKLSFLDWIIVVDDCSQDQTAAVVARESTVDPRIRFLRQATNSGVGGATLAGYREAIKLNATIVVKLDGDDQMDASAIIRLLRPVLRNKADFSKGNRFQDFRALRAMPKIRRMGNLALSFLVKGASGYWSIFDPTNGFFAVRTSVLKVIDLTKLDHRYFFEISQLCELALARAVVKDVPIPAKYGDQRSNLSVVKSLIEFPPKLVIKICRRILLQNFLNDLTLAGLYLLTGIPMLLFAVVYGGANFLSYVSQNQPAPTGTIVIPAMLLILGVQLILAAITADLQAEPREAVHRDIAEIDDEDVQLRTKLAS